ncbi:T9SS type A sorting domain-containing protein [Xanthovirga aplysinae]|uniref:T9SS type A sorting domain-containing protein n=1 Tax=Xanthovirga aplysinae TaxID=2529853 RepID=UPI0012BB7AEB|nr:T9SS type A sorting domain-containing protein [Xanthovirga aplysinae]MTI31377.1 T9SS type A sorting domain-containing protein [Xanthovirga aplysinae]
MKKLFTISVLTFIGVSAFGSNFKKAPRKLTPTKTSQKAQLPEDYCTPLPRPQAETMEEVRIGDYDFFHDYISRDNGNYQDRTNKEINLIKNFGLPIVIGSDLFVEQPPWVFSQQSIKVWIDYNQDFIFDNENELVINGWIDEKRQDPDDDVGNAFPNFHGSFITSELAYTGKTRMRIQMSPNGESTACEVSAGMVLDYTVNILEDELDYCIPENIINRDEWIGHFYINNLHHEVGQLESYNNFTHETFKLNLGQSHTFRIVPDFRDQIYKEHVSVWVDFNLDGHFDNTTELIVEDISEQGQEVISEVYFPDSISLEPRRMRVGLKFNSYKEGACEDSYWGQVLDYTIDFRKASSLIQPSNITFTLEPEIEEITDLSYHFYPNPSLGGNINLAFKSDKPEKIKLEIRSITGLSVYKKSLELIPEEVKTIQLRKALKGVYLFQIKGERTTVVERIILK